MKHIFSYEIGNLKSPSVLRKAVYVSDSCDLVKAFEDFERLAAFEDIDFSVYDESHVIANLLVYGEAILSYTNHLIRFKWEEA